MRLAILSVFYDKYDYGIACIKSIDKAIKYVKRHTDIKVVECRYYANIKEYELQPFVELEHRPTVIFGPNKGKASAINEMMQEIKECDYVIHIDGDITVGDRTIADLFSIHHRYLDINRHVIVPEQGGNRCHCYEKYPESIIHQTVFNGYEHCEMLISERGRGVAGGVLMGGCGLLRKCPYKTSTGVYGGNEASLWAQLPSNSVIIAKDTVVYHPEEPNEQYQQWKIQTQNQIRTRGIGRNKGFYDV